MDSCFSKTAGPVLAEKIAEQKLQNKGMKKLNSLIRQIFVYILFSEPPSDVQKW
jgi:hypothetical protein